MKNEYMFWLKYVKHLLLFFVPWGHTGFKGLWFALVTLGSLPRGLEIVKLKQLGGG